VKSEKFATAINNRNNRYETNEEYEKTVDDEGDSDTLRSSLFTLQCSMVNVQWSMVNVQWSMVNGPGPEARSDAG
jgi:hypothetical protein